MFSLLGTGGVAALGLVALVAGAGVKYSYDSGVAAKTINNVKERQAKLNAVIQQDDDIHRHFLGQLYTDYAVDVALLQQVPAAPVETLPICPRDCRLYDGTNSP